MSFHLTEESYGVGLDHVVLLSSALTAIGLFHHGLLDFTDPSPDNRGIVPAYFEQMAAGHQGCIPHHCVLIHDGLFHIPFYGTQHGRIDDIDQYSDGVGAVQRNVASHILGKAGSDNDDIGGIAERLNLLEEKIDYAAEAWVGGNEEFGGREEEFGGFCGSECIVVGTITIGGNIFGIGSVVMEVEDLGDDGAAFARFFTNQFVVVKYAENSLFIIGFFLTTTKMKLTKEFSLKALSFKK